MLMAVRMGDTPFPEAAMWTPEVRALVGDFGSGQALSDDQYRLIEPFIPPAKPGGRPRTTDMRRLLDGLFYVVRTGCQWRHVPPPPAFPPWQTIHGYFRAWLILGFGVLDPVSGDQGANQRAEESFSPSARVMDELKEPKIEREFLLRNAAMRPQPGPQQ